MPYFRGRPPRRVATAGLSSARMAAPTATDPRAAPWESRLSRSWCLPCSPDRGAWMASHRFELLVVGLSSPFVPLALAVAPAVRLPIVAKAFKTLRLAKGHQARQAAQETPPRAPQACPLAAPRRFGPVALPGSATGSGSRRALSYPRMRPRPGRPAEARMRRTPGRSTVPAARPRGLCVRSSRVGAAWAVRGGIRWERFRHGEQALHPRARRETPGRAGRGV
jgi:hypothetical protein